MHKFEFAEDDLFVNRLKTYPEYNIFIYQGNQITNRETDTKGTGGLIVYDIETSPHPQWLGGLRGRPMISSSAGYRQDFRSVLANPTVDSFSQNLAYSSQNSIIGSQAGLFRFKEFNSARTLPGGLTGSYGRSVGIVRKLTRRVENISFDAFDLTTANIVPYNVPIGLNATASALLTVADKYVSLSPHFVLEGNRGRITGSLGHVPLVGIPNRNLLNEDINFIFIPQIYSGSRIKKGSVNLKYILTGSQVAQCSDINENGELIEITGSIHDGNRVSGSVVGLVLYDEGIIMLTASHNLEAPSNSLGIHYKQDPTAGNSSPVTSSWLHFGTTMNDGTASSGTNMNRASYELNFKGTSYVTSMTMFAHARKGQLNHSNNPTYRDYTETLNVQTGSGDVFYQGSTAIKNIVTASHTSASFEKITYISKVNIYDKNHNLIAVTTLAKPLKKTEAVEYTFKMKLDL